jgi:hypothetical protein
VSNHFLLYSSHCIYRRRMRSYQVIAFVSLIDDTLFGAHKTDAGVGSGRRRRF